MQLRQQHHPGRKTIAKEALIVVDVQNDFCAGGALAVTADDAIIAAVNRLIGRYRHVILTQDWHAPDHGSFASNHVDKVPYDTITLPYGPQILWPDHCIRGTKGADFHPLLQTSTAALVLRKGCDPAVDSYSAFFENDRQTQTGLGAYLKERGVERLTLCGLATDFCVAYSALDAVRYGFQTRVVLGACQAIDINGSLDEALRHMQSNGVELTLST